MTELYYLQCYFELVGDDWVMRHAQSLDYSGRNLNKDEEGFAEPKDGGLSWIVDNKGRVEVLWSMQRGVKLTRANLDWPSIVESYSMEEALIERPSALFRWGKIENEVVEEVKKRLAKGTK